MISEAAVATMRKMAKHSRGPSAQRGMTAGRAWRQSLPKSAEEYLHLIASVKSFETEVMPLDDLVAELTEAQLVTTLKSGRSFQGLMVMDPALLASLLEVQTVGTVFTTDPPPRVPSDTDLALVDHVINRLMADQERALATGGGAAIYRGFRVAERMEDARAVSLCLDEGDYVVNRLTLDLALGARLGRLFLAYPKDAVSDGDSDEAERAQIEGTTAKIMSSSADLTAVLVRMQMSLSQISDLEPDSLVPLPGRVIGQVRLEDLEGRKVAQARLGQSGGFRAVLLVEEGEDEGALSDAPPALGSFAAPDMAAPTIGDLGGDAIPALEIGEDAFPALDASIDDLPPLEAGGDLPPLGGDLGELPDLDGEASDLPPLDFGGMDDLPDLPPLN